MNSTIRPVQTPSTPSDKSGAPDAHPLDIATQVSITDKNIRQRQRDAATAKRNQQGQYTCPISGLQHG